MVKQNYDAVFEDVMEYLPSINDDVDTPKKLKRFLRQYDRQKRMSALFIDELVNTRTAEALLNRQTTIAEFNRRKERNRRRDKQQRQALIDKGIKPSESFNTKTTNKRYVTFVSRNRMLYFDDMGRIRNRVTGRFAKK